MKLKFLGAAQTVTGSRICFEHYHYKGLIDCGLFQGSKEMRTWNWTPQPELLETQAVILTHAHIDHSGYLPKLFQLGYRKPIYCSKPTKDLLKIMLLDSAKLQEEDAQFANRTKHSHHEPALPLYTTQDALKCLEHVHAVNWDEWIPLSEKIGFRLMRSGHILGSSFVQLSYSNGQKSKIVTFSGDLGTFKPEIIKPPVTLLETDTLIIESTYGDRELKRNHIEEELAQIVKTVFERGGTLIVPAFAVGRTQDLLWYFHRLKNQNRIPNIPIYLDSPMASEVTALYLKHQDEWKNSFPTDELYSALSSPSFRATRTPDESMLLCQSSEPKVVISASGMLQGGRVLHHLKMKLPDPKSAVLFVGFQSQGTKGRLLKGGINKIRLHHQEIDIEASIYSIEGLSAHADCDELLRWMKNFKVAPKLTLINHGEIDASEALQYSVQTELGWSNVKIPELNESHLLE